MNHKLRAWLLIVALFLLCGGSVATLVRFKTRPLSPGAMASQMPPDAMTLYVDFAALKRSGLMDRIFGSKNNQDPDYVGFVERSGFDFRNHLTSLMMGFAPSGTYILVNGKFDWPKLREYAEKHGGTCYMLNCNVAGSVPGRRISFLPIRTKVMAIAVTTRDNAAGRLANRDDDPDVEVPDAAVWLSIPAGALKKSNLIPSGAQSIATAVERAENVMFTLDLEKGQLTANMTVQCLSEWDARTVAENLLKFTTTLQSLIEREGQKPNPADLSGVLSSGTFRSTGTRVSGRWTIPDAFVSNVLEGSVK